jgi:hypothetical protein
MTFILKWHREAGILILTVSLLFLPWFRDLSPPSGRPPVITGMEFITYGSWAVILAYSFIWAAYAASRLTTYKRFGVIALIVSALLYLYVLSAMLAPLRGDAPGIPLDKYTVSFLDKSFPPMIGTWVNLASLFIIAAGLFSAETDQEQKSMIKTGIGTFIVFSLLIGIGMAIYGFEVYIAILFLGGGFLCVGLPLAGGLIAM